MCTLNNNISLEGFRGGLCLAVTAVMIIIADTYVATLDNAMLSG